MKKKLIIGTLICILSIYLNAGGVFAVYQMKPNQTATKDTLNNFMYKVRQMEANGNVMGKTESGTNIKDNGTLLASTASNNIDVHMQKNTEYGACVILSASQKYGKQGTGAESYIHQVTSTGIATTTGNQYGVYNMGTAWEWTAGGGAFSYHTSGHRAPNYNARYYDLYNPLTEKAGDATTSTTIWKGSFRATFVSAYHAFKRGEMGAFSYGYAGNDAAGYYSEFSSGVCFGRAVAVVGTGHLCD